MIFLAVMALFFAILVPILVLILGKFLDVLIVPRSFIFFFMLSSSVKDLQASTEALRARKVDIDKKILEDERKSRSPTSQVKDWKKNVDDIMREILNFLNDYEGRRHDRGYSILSNYSAAIKCADYFEKVKDLLERGKFDSLTMDSSINNSPIPTKYEVPGSLKLKYEEALQYVLNGNSHNVIGIWGMGGVGKTSFLKKMHNSCIGRPIFDHVIWIEASSEQSNSSKVQSEIVKNLELNEGCNFQSQARIIHNFLENKNFLLFIDNLWEDVDLLEIGVPDISCRICGKKRKVVFTTRELRVCGNMEAKETIKVECLKWDESWLLFREKVGEQVIHSDPSILKLANVVANECKGLPLALIAIGRAMSTKRSPKDWELALTLMRKSQVQDVSGTKIHEMQRILKISYDFLDKEVLKKCFLSISMWPKGYSIWQEDLILCWMGLDIIDNFESLEEAFQRGYSYIGSLWAACLLEIAEDNTSSYYNYNNNVKVKLHDALRDLATWIASDFGENRNKWIMKAGTRLPETELKWSEAECISLMSNLITELPFGKANCHNLHTLVLSNTLVLSKNKFECVLDSILKNFRNFPSLKYLDLSSNKLNDFPESICGLKELQFLNLSYNDIANIPERLSDLKKLKYLMLGQNRIRNIPKGVFSGLEKLLVLDIFSDLAKVDGPNVEELKCFAKKLLCLGINVGSEKELNKLMLLSDLPIRRLCIQELNDMSFHFMSIIPNPYTSKLRQCLKTLSIVHSYNGLLEIVFDKDKTWEHPPSLNVTLLRFFNLGVQRIIWKDLCPKGLFANLEDIDFIRCSALEHVTWVIHLPSLKGLTIHGCNNMIIAIHNGDHDNNYEGDSGAFIFTSLEVLRIIDMEILQKFSTCSLAFPQLDSLTVVRCPLLKTPPYDLLTSPKLQNIIGERPWSDQFK